MDISFVKTPAIQDLLYRVAGTASDKGASGRIAVGA